MIVKKKLLEEKSKKLQKLEQQLQQVSTTSMAPASSAATGANTCMRYLPPPVTPQKVNVRVPQRTYSFYVVFAWT